MLASEEMDCDVFLRSKMERSCPVAGGDLAGFRMLPILLRKPPNLDEAERVEAGRVADAVVSLDKARFSLGGDCARAGTRVGEGLPVREADWRVEEETIDVRLPSSSLDSGRFDGEALRDRALSGGSMTGTWSWVLLRECIP